MRLDAAKLDPTPPGAGGTGRDVRGKAALLAALAALLLVLLGSAPAHAAGWQPPADLSAAGQTALMPRVAVNSAGTAVASWTRSNGTNYIVQAAVRPPDAAWQPAIDISAIGRDAAEAQVAIDPQGNIVATWQRSNGKNLVIQAAVKPAGGAWQSPIDLSVGPWHSYSPRVAMDAQGTAIIVWQSFDSAFSIIQSAVRPAGGTWQATTNVSVTGRDATAPAVAVNPQGAAVAVWQRSNGTNVVIQSAARPAGGAWQAPADISAAGASAATPQVAIDPSGTAVAVWERQKIVQGAARPAGGAWQSPTNLSAACQLAPNPQIAVSQQGVAGAIWSCVVGSSPIVQTARRPAGGAWDAAVTLAGSGNAITPAIAFDPNGNAIAMWALAVRSVIQGTTRPVGGAWQPAADLTASAQNATGPQLAADGRGNAVAVWRRYNGSHFLAQGVRYDGEAPMAHPVSVPAAGLVGEQLTFSIAPVGGRPLGPTTWSFGDGATASGATVTHAYPRAGTFMAAVTTSDPSGVFTTSRAVAIVAPAEGGGTGPGPGPGPGPGTGTGTGAGAPTTGTTPPSASGTPAGTPPPAAAARIASIDRLGLSRSKFRAPRSGPSVMARAGSAGTRVSYVLNVAANVRFIVQRRSTGRISGGRCVRTTTKNRKKKSCTLYTTLRGSFARSRPAGRDAFAFSGRVDGHALKAGRYRLVATPVAAGRVGAAKRVTFRIVR